MNDKLRTRAPPDHAEDVKIAGKLHSCTAEYPLTGKVREQMSETTTLDVLTPRKIAALGGLLFGRTSRGDLR